MSHNTTSPIGLRPRWMIHGFFALLSITGCASIGSQYTSPLASDSHATLVPKGGAVLINVHDEKGCYQGRTELPGGKEFRLQPDKPVIFLYEIPNPPRYPYILGTESVCRALVSFIPKAGASYTVTSIGTELVRARDGRERWSSCGALVEQNLASGQTEPTPVKKLVLRQRSIACIQAVEQ